MYNLEDMRPSWVDFLRILRESPRLTNFTLFYSGLAKPFRIGKTSQSSCRADKQQFNLHLVTIWATLHAKPEEALRGDFSGFIRQLAMPPRSVFPDSSISKSTACPVTRAALTPCRDDQPQVHWPRLQLDPSCSSRRSQSHFLAHCTARTSRHSLPRGSSQMR
jgi:hypothetical protein